MERELARVGGSYIDSTGALGDDLVMCGAMHWRSFEGTYGSFNTLTWIIRGIRTYGQRRD